MGLGWLAGVGKSPIGDKLYLNYNIVI